MSCTCFANIALTSQTGVSLTHQVCKLQVVRHKASYLYEDHLPLFTSCAHHFLVC